MTDTAVELENVEPVGSAPAGQPAPVSDEQLVAMLVERARSEGLQLTGQGGLLQQLTKRVLESALEGEITDHLGYERHDAVGRGSGNSRNGSRAKTVLTDVGPVDVKVPRDTAGSFEPQIVKKRRRRLTGNGEMVLSLSAKGLTHGEISAHLAEVYGAEVSEQTVSTITGQVMEGMAEWQNRPLDRVYPVLFVDAVNVRIRDGKVANRPIYVVMAVTVDGTRDILGIWAGDGGEGAEYWLHVFTELKNRGLDDVLMLVCDGLKGLPEAVETVWPRTIVQTCVVHLLRNSFRHAARQDWDKVAGALKPVSTAPGEDAATERFLEFRESWGRKYPAIVKLWSDAWAEFVPFLAFDVEIRKVISSTNAIESVNARIRGSVRARGHFPNEAAALKCIYMALMSLDPTGKGRKRWTMRWKAPLNAFQIAFEGRLTSSNN
ncbi:transposase mutator family protein [Streptomyces lincolnensis]|uniref:Mutator family transposase n=2 Tax=Streptomyces lincolnensis TaxID=1915 RepID=A0A1B1M134_STRLN|nr:transposase mutator family protein [Streptomyces lincolnensis]AXG51236.1 transposase mutator family protein [Streptomyces lincolnensis]QMV04312.1 IS256 family transposase [Streptomyces lincolnensis]QMV12011.1 IS256 family transposase [Streptomyces lincolnensis]